MRDGFISVAAGTPKIRVADCRYNAEQIFTLMREADKQGVKVLALPELCLTGYTCGDLFLQDTLLRGAEEGLQTILEATRNLEIVTALGLPVWDKWDNKLYNCAAIIQKGEILGLIPKVYLPNYGEFYEQRWFASGSGVEHGIELCGQHVSLCTNQTFACDTMPNLVIGVEICEDLWAPAPPSVELARKGATVILNLSASNELVGKADYRRSLVTGQSARLMCGYVYADAGEGESTTDVVFTGHNMIAENGTLLAERRFATGLTVSEIDVDRLIHDRRRTNTFTFGKEPPEIWRCGFTLPVEETRLTRYVSPSPFVPEDAAGRAERCEEILRIASLGLKKRLEHTGAKTAVVGLSGGLDSTLALLITALLGLPELEEAVTQLILFAWGYAESVKDMRMLFDGEKVPVIKDGGSWNTPYSQLLTFRGHLSEYPKGQSGLGYEDYLQALLFLMPQEKVTGRLMDIMETDIRRTKGNSCFRIDGCIDGMRAEAAVSSGYGYQYTITRSYGYE